MMYRSINDQERFVNRACAVMSCGIERGSVNSCGTPRVSLSVYECETWVGDVKAAVFVDGGDVWRGVDAEGVVADYGEVGEVVCARPEG